MGVKNFLLSNVSTIQNEHKLCYGASKDLIEIQARIFDK